MTIVIFYRIKYNWILSFFKKLCCRAYPLFTCFGLLLFFVLFIEIHFYNLVDKPSSFVPSTPVLDVHRTLGDSRVQTRSSANTVQFKQPSQEQKELISELQELLHNRIFTVEEFRASLLHNVSVLRHEQCNASHGQSNTRNMSRRTKSLSDKQNANNETLGVINRDGVPFIQTSEACHRPCQKPSSSKRKDAKYHMAFIIPYRERADHLKQLLARLQPLLNQQKACFRIFVVEQVGNEIFNKGRLMNAGFLEALKVHDFDCFVFHDVDLVPQSNETPYGCLSQPRHISVSVDEFNYTMPYDQLVGGVLAFTTFQFLKVNGYSNMYWGWGAEDDDMASRIQTVHMVITRPNPKIAVFNMIKHNKRKQASIHRRHALLNLAKFRYRLDGLNSLVYNVQSTVHHPGYTHIFVNIGTQKSKSTS